MSESLDDIVDDNDMIVIGANWDVTVVNNTFSYSLDKIIFLD